MNYKKFSHSYSQFIVLLIIAMCQLNLPAHADKMLINKGFKPAPKESSKRPAITKYDQHPIYFEKNVGQANPKAKFISRSEGYKIFLTQQGEAVFSIKTSSMPNPALTNSDGLGGVNVRIPNQTLSTFSMKFADSNPKPKVTSEDELLTKVNYFIGNDSRKWHTDISTYGKVRYQEVYPGVDVLFYGTQRQLEYDFVVAPKANPAQVQIEFTGVDNVSIDRATGDLVIKVADQEIHQHKPFTYQLVNGVKQEVASSYYIQTGTDSVRVGFNVSSYDRNQPLVIDPTLEYSVLLGGGAGDFFNHFRVDSTGAVYVIGVTVSSDLPTKSPFQQSLQGQLDTLVAKFSPTGTLVFATYLGGTNGEVGLNIAIDATGNMYLVGGTLSTDFPTVNPLQSANRAKPGAESAYVTKLNSTGNTLVFSTYFGGQNQRLGLGLGDQAIGITVDSNNNVYFCGFAISPDFPVTPGVFQNKRRGGFDAFIAKLDPNGTSLVYATLLGGDGNVVQGANSIVVDSGGNAYVVGVTASRNFPTTSGTVQEQFGGATDLFISKINPTGSNLVFSTYLGGGDTEDAVPAQGGGFFTDFNGITLDTMGNIYIASYTVSANYPVANAIQNTYGGGARDAVVSKLDPTGSKLLFSTYLGGTRSDGSFGDPSLDAKGNLYIAGDTFSNDFPTVRPIQNSNGGGEDAFVVRIDQVNNRLDYSTYLGGNDNDFANNAIADPQGNVYIAGAAKSKNFPAVNSSQSSTNGDFDGFIAKISDDKAPPTVTVILPNGNEKLIAGQMTSIFWSATDDVGIVSQDVAISTDGGSSFPITVSNNLAGDIRNLTFNIPLTLTTMQGRVKVTARDKAGNSGQGVSQANFSINPPPSNSGPSLFVSIKFDPPPAGQVAPPMNVRVDATNSPMKSPLASGISNTRGNTSLSALAGDTTLVSYNIYRVVQPSLEKPQPTAQDIVGNPANLVVSIPANQTSFMDIAPKNQGDNFVYSVTSFFGNGMMSGGSQPAGTNIPIIKNPTFAKGVIFLDSPGSFIQLNASLIVDGKDSYKLKFDESGTRFTIEKKMPSMESGTIFKKLIKKGVTVQLIVKNPDGKMSLIVPFTRK